VIDGPDADILKYLERFGEDPPVPSRAPRRASDRSCGHVARPPIRRRSRTTSRL
jgi:hypothetical protein